MDAANLLRAYHAALSKARTGHGVLRASRHFRAKHEITDAQWLLEMAEIRHAHLGRACGESSPASCDAALQRALRDMGA